MATINNIPDLLRLLDENPEWVEELRRRLLSRELLELPERFAELAERFTELAERLAELGERFSELGERFSDLAALVTRKFDDNDRQFAAIRDDLTHIKGRYAMELIARSVVVIALEMGLSYAGEVTQFDLNAMLRANDTGDLPRNHIISFAKADLIFWARDAEDNLCYVAVEASFTADERDTRRALRNAEYLTRFTGLPARAVVASVKNDDRIKPEIDSGRVFWFELERADFFEAE